MEATGFMPHAYDLWSILILLSRAAVPDSDGKCQDALNRSAVKLSQDGMTDFECLYLSQEEKPLVGLLGGGDRSVVRAPDS